MYATALSARNYGLASFFFLIFFSSYPIILFSFTSSNHASLSCSLYLRSVSSYLLPATFLYISFPSTSSYYSITTTTTTTAATAITATAAAATTTTTTTTTTIIIIIII
jgi:hypothetical protein